MMQSSVPRERQGSMISANTFYMTIAGTVGTALCGIISNGLNASANPYMFGRILAVITTASSLASIPFYWLAGKYFKEHIEE